jgi:hypothetical protein
VNVIGIKDGEMSTTKSASKLNESFELNAFDADKVSHYVQDLQSSSPSSQVYYFIIQSLKIKWLKQRVDKSSKAFEA